MNQAAQSNVDVTIGATGYNPYRNSQLASTDLWVKAGMPKELAENYLGAINGALNNPNMASDMKIPGAQEVPGVVLDTELAANSPAKSRSRMRSRTSKPAGRSDRGFRPRRTDQAQGLALGTK